MKKLLLFFIACITLISCNDQVAPKTTYNYPSEVNKWDYIGNNTYITIYELDSCKYLVFRASHFISVVPLNTENKEQTPY